MKRLSFIFVVLILCSCISTGKDDVTNDQDGKFSMLPVITDRGKQYLLIRDNLYRDGDGNVFLKTADVSAADHGDPSKNLKATKIRWISHAYLHSSPDQTEISLLKDIIDTATFRLGHRDASQGADIYKDRSHSYLHKQMADGGTLQVLD